MQYSHSIRKMEAIADSYCVLTVRIRQSSQTRIYVEISPMSESGGWRQDIPTRSELMWRDSAAISDICRQNSSPSTSEQTISAIAWSSGVVRCSVSERIYGNRCPISRLVRCGSIREEIDILRSSFDSFVSKSSQISSVPWIDRYRYMCSLADR